MTERGESITPDESGIISDSNQAPRRRVWDFEERMWVIYQSSGGDHDDYDVPEPKFRKPSIFRRQSLFK